MRWSEPTPILWRSNVLRALLRALVFVAVLESIFFRLLPVDLFERLGGSWPLFTVLSESSQLAFFLAFMLLILCILTLAQRALRFRPWPSGLNGMVAACLVCVAGLALSAVMLDRGPVFAIGFTALSLITMLLVAAHAFSSRVSRDTELSTVREPLTMRFFLVVYAGAVVCSLTVTTVEFLQRLDRAGHGVDSVMTAAESAGHALLFLAGIAAFLSFTDLDGSLKSRPVSSWLVVLLAGFGAAAFAAGSLLPPGSIALLGPDPGAVSVLMLTFGLFTGVAAAGLNIADPARRPAGYALLLLILAGFPLRIVQQDLMMVAGIVLLLSPPVRPLARESAWPVVSAAGGPHLDRLP